MPARDVTFASDEERLAARFVHPAGSGPWPAVVLVHGLGSDGRTMLGAARDLACRGVAALAFDQRGHGRSTGVYTGDSSEDVAAAGEFLAGLPEVDGTRIGVMGHSSGAREAILACLWSRRFSVLVSTSTPPDGEGGVAVRTEGFYTRVRSGGRDGIHAYPRDGALPWLGGRLLRGTSWCWSWLRGYRLRVRWQDSLVQWARLRAGIAIQEMAPRPLLIVHCRGDRAVPVTVAEALYHRASQPKELLTPSGGWHSTPLLPGPVRRAWVSWLVEQLKAEVRHGLPS